MNNELKHYGVPGMKWGVRKDRIKQSIERRKIDKGKFGPEQNRVLSDRNAALRSTNKAWKAAHKAGKGTKEWEEWERSVSEVNKKFKPLAVEAFITDNRIKELSEAGRKYLEDKIGYN